MKQSKPKTNPAAVGNNYVTQPSAKSGLFSRDECKRIIQLSEVFAEKEGMINNVPSVKPDTRNSKVRRIHRNLESKWLFEKLQSIVRAANQFYKFKLSGINETLQVASYTNGEFYDWHMDVGLDQTSTRKLSISVQLSERGDYEGGELEFMNIDTSNISKEIGTFIIFPSFLTHRVTPVTRGTRKSLVLWFHGPSFE